MTTLRIFVALFAFVAGGSAQPVVQLGSETLAAERFAALQGKKVGLLTNPSGVNSRGEWIVDVLRKAPRVNLVALFAAEHGIDGEVKAGIEFSDHMDRRTGLRVFSLYGPGPVRAPTSSMLEKVDVIVYDIQDTGCRSYTYISSMGMAMEACAEAGVEFLVLDRPNPLGGYQVEGPILDRKFESMVGKWPIPYVYGMTPGELALMINGEGWIKKSCQLTVSPMRGWRRAMSWKDTGLPWKPTSPHIPFADSPLYYVSTGILGEIGGVSIGIGHSTPFQCIAAPWLDANRLSETMNGYRLRGVQFDPVHYKPRYGAYHGQMVHGVEVIFTEPSQAPLMAINLYALDAVKRVGGRDLFAEKVATGKSFSMFEKVTGTDVTRKALELGKAPREIQNSWEAGERQFRQDRRKYLLY